MLGFRPSIAALSAVGLIAVPALAQPAPDGRSCGGLLCDMGVFGHKVQAAPAPVPPAPAPAPVPMPKSEQTAAIVPAPAPVAVLPAHKPPGKKRVARSASPKVVNVKAKPAVTKVTATPPAVTTPRPVGAPGGAATGEVPPSPADMFQPIYR